MITRRVNWEGSFFAVELLSSSVDDFSEKESSLSTHFWKGETIFITSLRQIFPTTFMRRAIDGAEKC